MRSLGTTACPSLSILGPPPFPCPLHPEDATQILPDGTRGGQFQVPTGSKQAERAPCPRGAYMLVGTQARKEADASTVSREEGGGEKPRCRREA